MKSTIFIKGLDQQTKKIHNWKYLKLYFNSSDLINKTSNMKIEIELVNISNQLISKILFSKNPLLTFKLNFKKKIYPIRNSSWYDGFDHDSSAPPTNNPEAQSGSIVDQVNHLHLSPLSVELLRKKNTHQITP